MKKDTASLGCLLTASWKTAVLSSHVFASPFQSLGHSSAVMVATKVGVNIRPMTREFAHKFYTHCPTLVSSAVFFIKTAERNPSRSPTWLGTLVPDLDRRTTGGKPSTVL